MPQRLEVFNLRDVAVEIDAEDIDGTPSGSPIVSDWAYIDIANLSDVVSMIRSFRGGKAGRRNTTTSHLYDLRLSRFHAKYSEDFGIVPETAAALSGAISSTLTYQIKLIVSNDEFPDLNETHTLRGCQLAGRSIRFGPLVNNVPTNWAVGEYIEPT